MNTRDWQAERIRNFLGGLCFAIWIAAFGTVLFVIATNPGPVEQPEPGVYSPAVPTR